MPSGKLFLNSLCFPFNFFVFLFFGFEFWLDMVYFQNSSTIDFVEIIQFDWYCYCCCRLYYAKIGIGTPTKDFYVQVDTGSDIMWVNCIQCTECPKRSSLGVCFSTLSLLCFFAHFVSFDINVFLKMNYFLVFLFFFWVVTLKWVGKLTFNFSYLPSCEIDLFPSLSFTWDTFQKFLEENNSILCQAK